MRTKVRIAIWEGIIFFFLLNTAWAEVSTSNKYLSEAQYYRTLLEFTCQLQIDYYEEFSAYLERVKAPTRPLLISYYTGLAYFELGRYKEAAQVFNQSGTTLKTIATLPQYKYFSQVMEAASLYQLGQKNKLADLAEKAESPPQKYFLGYILLRLNCQPDLAKKLLADCPENTVGVVRYQWIRYKLGLLPLDKLQIARYKLKNPEFEENYSQLKLKQETINLNVKYFNPAEIYLLREIALDQAQKPLDPKTTKDYAALGQISSLRGDYKSAISYLEDYRKAFPQDVMSAIWLGQCYRETGSQDKANSLWALIGKNGNTAARRELALALSVVPEKQIEALNLLKKAGEEGLTADPQAGPVYYQQHKDYYQMLGRIYLNLRKFKEAGDTLMLTYERSRAKQPQTYDQTYLLCLGFSLAKTRRFKDAIDYALDGAASLNPAVYQVFHAVNHGLYMLNYE